MFKTERKTKTVNVTQLSLKKPYKEKLLIPNKKIQKKLIPPVKPLQTKTTNPPTNPTNKN